MTNNKPANSFPVLPLRDIVVFPGAKVPLSVGRGTSIKALENAMRENRQIIVVTQKDPALDTVNVNDVYEVGVLCTINKIMQMPQGESKILISGEERVKLHNLSGQDYWRAEAEFIEPVAGPGPELTALAREALKDFETYAKMSKKVPPETTDAIVRIEDPAAVADALAASLDISIADKQALLEKADTSERLESVGDFLRAELGVIKAQQNIQKNTKTSMEKDQREYFLRKQMKEIQKELGEDEENEIEEFEERIAEADLPEVIEAKAQKELKKLKNMNPQGSEATVVRNYLGALLDFPWGNYSDVNYDLDQARKTLDTDHYGLDKVKKQVIENLAVAKRLEEKGASNDGEADILCLVGPPGVGKTSICQSLAKATGREYVRMAVGGVRDEAEIRGHRRTYIGAKPGKIVEKMMAAGTQNPLFVIDEIDKMGSDHRGDPSSAMLEVLDPEQNNAFEDHYLEVPIDLSKVKFVCTANDWGNIPGPLRDRMETIFLGSYTEDEKLEIAKQHLVRKQMKANGLSADEFSIDEAALRELVRNYTKESGVRTLQREVKNVCRKAVVALEGNTDKIEVTVENLQDYAGKPKYSYEKTSSPEGKVGKIAGLAYTSVGGEVLPIQAVKWPEKPGKFIATGRLGDVMKESIQVAEGWLKAKAGAKEIEGVSIEDVLGTTYRLHAPEGATPKDGPSAGAAILTAIFSAATGKPIRQDIAMTGELDLHGEVTAIGGVKEKLSGAARLGYKTVLIPQANEKDLEDVPEQVKAALEIIPVSRIEQVLEHALVGGYQPKQPSNDVMPPPDNRAGRAPGLNA